MLSVVLAGLVIPLLGVVGSSPAAAAPIDTPMTGKLPVCAAQMHDLAAHDVWDDDDDVNSQFDTNAELGLEQSCAWQGMQDRSNPSLWPRGVIAKAVPDEVSVNDIAQNIKFVIDGSTAAAPFNVAVPDCMPRSSRAGGCSTDANPGIYVAYRVASGAGTFSGPWTQVTDAGRNPYFDFTRVSGSCVDNYANWTPNYPHTGAPCDYTLRFATNLSGSPVLTKAMQVVVVIDWLTGTKTVGPNTGYDYGYGAVVPMLFTPGASTSLSLDPLPGRVVWGTALNLRAAAVGPPPGSPVNFYRKGANGVVTVVGQALGDAGGVATLPTTATGNAEYWARLAVGGTETTQSPTRAVGVGRGIVLTAKKPKKPGGKYAFTATLTPGTGAGQVVLQRKDGKKWVTVKTSQPAATVTWKIKPPPGKQTYRVLADSSTDFLESVSNEVKAKGKKKPKP